MTKETATSQDRLVYSGDLQPVMNRICAAYDIGPLQNFSVIDVGYEDCNIKLSTEHGDYLAKIFSKDRKPDDIQRYTTIMQKVLAAGVHHPPILKTHDNKPLFVDTQANNIPLVLMDFIHGKTFFELGRTPNPQEQKKILEQAARIHDIPYHPPFQFDSWAIPNIRTTYEKTQQFIQPKDMPLVEEALRRYSAIPIELLPHCFVHGDFTKTNVMKSDDDTIYILDFSVANWYPRIQELAVIAVNLLHDPTSSQSLRERCESVIEIYDQFHTVTQDERKYLYDYTIAGAAMEFLGSHQEKFVNKNDTEETEYWFRLGRETLQQALV